MGKLFGFLVFLAVGFCGAANAASVKYSYQGLPFGTGDPWSCNLLYFCDPWKGSIVIDDSRYPGGLAGSTLRLVIWNARNTANPCFDPQAGPSNCSTIEITAADGTTYSDVRQGWAVSWPKYGFLGFSGSMAMFIGHTGYIGFYHWDFDDVGNVSSWRGQDWSGWEGGWDPESYPTHDRIYESGCWDDDCPEDYYTLGPGTWTRTTPVPLPAGVYGLIGGIVLLAAASRRRNGCRQDVSIAKP